MAQTAAWRCGMARAGKRRCGCAGYVAAYRNPLDRSRRAIKGRSRRRWSPPSKRGRTAAVAPRRRLMRRLMLRASRHGCPPLRPLCQRTMRTAWRISMHPPRRPVLRLRLRMRLEMRLRMRLEMRLRMRLEMRLRTRLRTHVRMPPPHQTHRRLDLYARIVAAAWRAALLRGTAWRTARLGQALWIVARQSRSSNRLRRSSDS